MRKYTIEVVDTGKNMMMKRQNKGFSVFELLGFIELTKNELLTMAAKMNTIADKTVIAIDRKGKSHKVKI